MDMDRYIGKLLDNRYELLEVIGTGGMAVVYKARCHRLNRLVAVKILKDENLQDEDFRRRFRAEGQAVGMLSHPNIVSVYDVSTSDIGDYIVMELIDGISLKQYMEKKGVLNWKETLHFATQIAKGLEHAHSRDLVHRDIKPHNIMVSKNGSVRVTDFGIARMMTDSNTLTKETLGSVHYISPEQAKGGHVDNRSDIYSLGVVMYEMITGRPPFDGESPVSVAIQHIAGGAVKPSVLNPNIPVGLEQIIMKAMMPDLRRRYANATELLADLDAFRKDPTIVFPTVAMQPQKPVAQTPDQMSAQPVLRKEGVGKTLSLKPILEQEMPEEEKPRRPKRSYVEREISRGRIATAAVILCSVAIMVAVLLSLYLWMSGQGETTEGGKVQIPNLVGISLDFVPENPDYRVEQRGEEYNDQYAPGKIIKQLPEAGELVEKGRTIYVIVSKGPKPPDEKMRDMIGKSKAEVQAYLQSLNMELNVNFLNPEYSDTIPEGMVIRTDPEAGQVLRKGQKINVVISLGKDRLMATMPNLLNGSHTSKDSAESILHVKGFTNVEWRPVNSLKPENTIVSQSVAPNELVDITTHIIIEYSNGIPPEKQAVTIQYVLEGLPEDACTISLWLITESKEIATVVKAEGETSVTIELTGKGEQTYMVFIGTDPYQEITINFDEYGN